MVQLAGAPLKNTPGQLNLTGHTHLIKKMNKRRGKKEKKETKKKVEA